MDGLLLRLLPQPFVTREDRVDRAQQRCLRRGLEAESVADPGLELAARLRGIAGGGRLLGMHEIDVHDPLSHSACALTLQRPCPPQSDPDGTMDRTRVRSTV